MADVQLLAWDVGGVLLSNGWDHEDRRAACQQFGLEVAAFEVRHEQVVDAFERGRVSLDEYLDHTLAPASVDVGRGAFRQFMFERTSPHEPMLEFVRQLARENQYRLVTLNDESRELNLYRIQKFQLTAVFGSFFTSCFTGLRKPAPEAFRAMLDISQKDASETVFIDDRAENVAAAAEVGIRSVQYHDPAQVQQALSRNGVEFGQG